MLDTTVKNLKECVCHIEAMLILTYLHRVSILLCNINNKDNNKTDSLIHIMEVIFQAVVILLSL